MNSIKFGIKLWSSNSELYHQIVKYYKEGRFDYLELLYVPGKKDKIRELTDNKIPIVIHAPNFSQGVIFGDSRFKHNHEMLLEILEFASLLNSNEIIVHPDIGKKENFIRFLKANRDNVLIIENMPKMALDGSTCLGYNIKDMEEFVNVGGGGFGFCLDFGHAIKSAISQSIDPKKFLVDMIKLKPRMAHICDGRLNTEKDEHLSIGEGEFDFKFIVELIKSSCSIEKITFEVPKTNGLENDLRNIDLLKSFIYKV